MDDRIVKATTHPPYRTERSEICRSDGWKESAGIRDMNEGLEYARRTRCDAHE